MARTLPPTQTKHLAPLLDLKRVELAQPALCKAPERRPGHAPDVSVVSGSIGNPNPAAVDLDMAGLWYPRFALPAHSLALSVCCCLQQSPSGGLMGREGKRSIPGDAA